MAQMTPRDIEIAQRMIPARGATATARLLGLPESTVRKTSTDGRIWSSTEEAVAASLFIRYPVARTASLVGRSPEEIVAFAERKGIPLDGTGGTRSTWSAVEEGILKALLRDGAKTSEAAAQLGRSAVAVRRKLASANLRPQQIVPAEPWTREEYDLICTMYVIKRASSTAIAAAVSALGSSRSPAAIRAKIQYLRRAGEIA